MKRIVAFFTALMVLSAPTALAAEEQKEQQTVGSMEDTMFPGSEAGQGTEEISHSGQTLPVSVKVDERQVIKPADRRMLGLNSEWDSGHAEVLLGDLESTEPNSVLAEILKDVPMPLSRMAGSSSQTIKWKGNLGSMEDREEQQPWPWDTPTKQNLGVVEYVKAVQSVDADAGFTFVLNMREETPQDWADLAEFLTGDGTNPNGGENWAQMRIDSGIEKPVNVEVWEFGNEMDWGSAENVFSPEKYVNLCHQGIEAIRTVDPDAVFAAQSATAPWNEGDRTPDWRTWNRTVLEGLKDDIDYLTLHAYYYGMSLDEIEDDYLDVISSDIREVTGDNRIKIYISEHAIWPSDTESRESYTETTNLQSMLGVCEFFSRMMQREDVELASYHCLTGLWAFVRQQDGEFYATTMLMLFKLYNEMLGDNVVKVTQSGELAEGDNTNFVTNAMTTDKGLNLIISNRTNDMKRQASFVFNGQYKVSKIHTITSENSWLDDNVPGSTPVTLTTVENASDEIFTGCLVPERSIIAIELEKIEPKTFCDIAGHWAEASIAMLASKGSLFWIENSKFLPEQNITRAEFAAIVADVMELPQNETPTFEDVTADKWYYGDVNAVADAEYINGVSETAFEPEQLLTRQEIAVITARILTSLEKDYSSVQLSYPDAEDIEAWAAEGVTTAVAAGLMQGDEEGFRPFDHLTRAEAVVIAVRMLDKI